MRWVFILAFLSLPSVLRAEKIAISTQPKPSVLDAAAGDDITQLLQQQALPDLISSLTEKKNHGKHFRIIHVDGALQDHQASRYLMQAYEESTAEGIRCKLLESMGKLHDPTLFDWLSRRVNDPQESIACFAIWALGELKTARARPILSHKLWSSSRYVQMTAIDALGKTGKDSNVAVALELFLKDDDVEMRFLTAKALLGVASQDSLPDLIQALRQESSIDVQEALAKTVGSIGGAQAAGYWVEVLKHSPSQTTAHLAEVGLVALDPDVLFPAIAPLLESGDIRLQVAAARVLRECELPSSDSIGAQAWLKKWLQSSDLITRETAKQVMARRQTATEDQSSRRNVP